MRFGILALIAGFLLDLLLGDPEWLYHPVRLIGKYISFAEKRLRARGGNLRKSAVLLTVSTVLLTMAAVALILFLLHFAGQIPLFIGMALMNWKLSVPWMWSRKCTKPCLSSSRSSRRIRTPSP